MPTGTAQGIALHSEYKGRVAVLVEIDCRPETVNRTDPRRLHAARASRRSCAWSTPGCRINPRGLEAQMMGGIMDGIALALTSSLHIQDGTSLEGSWDNYFYTRQWNAPLDARRSSSCRRRPVSPAAPASSAVAPAFAAVACAYARATGTMPTHVPDQPRPSARLRAAADVPPIPASTHRRPRRARI